MFNQAQKMKSVIEVVILVAAIVACLASLSIIVTYCVFVPIRNKRFMKFILYMSSCDLGLGIITLFGYPDSGSAMCYVQGILCIYFSMCSWFWTTALSYVTYCIIVHGNFLISDVWLHLFCWGVPLLLALIPFINATYGSLNQVHVQWCLIINDASSPAYASTLWSYLSYFGWLFLCCGLMIFWTVRVHWMLHKRKDTLSAAVVKTYDRVAWYPVAMAAFWILNFICNDLPRDENNLVAGLSMLTGVSYGTATAVIFWYKSEECRRRWMELLFPVRQQRLTTTVMPVDFEEDRFIEDSIIPSVVVYNNSTDSVMSKEASFAIRSAKKLAVVLDTSQLTRESYNSGFHGDIASDLFNVHAL
jgi:hypothetical protein